MRFNFAQINGKLFVSIDGELSEENSSQLLAALRDANRQHFSEAIFDLSRVPCISKRMMGKLVMFYKNNALRGRKMRIKGLHENIAPSFHTLRINELFPVEQ